MKVSPLTDTSHDSLMFFYVGKVYAVGGHDGNEHLGNMEMFDPLTNKWMMKASMNTKRYPNLFENRA